MAKAKGTTKKKQKLTLKQRAFCEYFASDREFFGNGTQSYIEAYGIDASKPGSYAAARVSAHTLLTNPNILDEINRIFEARGLNDVFVDKQLEKLITQDADFPTKLRAIQEYNKLKSRITDKLDLTTKGDKIGAVIEFENKPK